MFLLLLLAIAGLVVAFFQKNKAAKALKRLQEVRQTEVTSYQAELSSLKSAHDQDLAHLQKEISSLARFKDVRDTSAFLEETKAEAEKLAQEARFEAARVMSEAKVAAEEILRSAGSSSKERLEKADFLLSQAGKQAQKIVDDAGIRADQIAGDAYRALKEADRLVEVENAMRNLIEGYGNKYVKPTYSLIDELAQSYGFDEAGQQLKLARDRSRGMVDGEQAAACDYVEKNRKETAVRFIVDAFNGKVDSILSRSKSDNYGTLEQQVKDAYALVNNNGIAFRNARITPEYLEARLSELKWAVAVHELREREKEEQRQIREKIREEERAQREIEKALKDAQKEEEVIQKAMAKVSEQVSKAGEAQKAEFEAKLAELQAKLLEAEARNQRALSMAQKTKAGHVYVISNIGSFGENVFKVGMTRRLEPFDRIKELGDASVPFSFDVHAMIWCEDAPRLESSLHRKFVKAQINKVNPRKEFFRIPISDLKRQIESLGINAAWTIAGMAAEYQQTLAIEAELSKGTPEAQDWLMDQIGQQENEVSQSENAEVA